MEKGTTLGRVRIAKQLADLLRAELGSGRWAAGEKLPSELALAREFGVGRSSAREAVQELARDGLLDVRHGTGTFVAESSAPSTVADMLRRARIIEVYEVRRGLEVEAARLAALRADRNGLRAVDELLHSRQELVGMNTTEFVDADLRFHRAIVALSGNNLLCELFDEFHDALRDALIALVDGEPEVPDTGREHAELLAALHAGDPGAAVVATIGHFDLTIARLGGGPERTER